MKKVFISFDFEGLAGVTKWEETINSKRFNKLATEQINAFLKGLHSDRDLEITLCDSHADGNNLIWEDLYGNTKLVKGYPRHFYMIEGLDETFDSFMLFGYHAPIGHEGNMDHTYSASTFYEVKINGQIMDEAFINTIMATSYNVPLDFVFCDNQAKMWLKKNISPELNILESKKAIARHAAINLPFNQIMENLYNAGKNIKLGNGIILEDIFRNEFKCEIKFTDTNTAYGAMIVPGVKKTSPRALEFNAKSAKELYKYLMTVIGMSKSVK